MLVLHIYGARAVLLIILLFCVHQDTGYEECEIYMMLFQPIFTHKKNQRTYETTVFLLYKTGEKYCGNSSYLWS